MQWKRTRNQMNDQDSNSFTTVEKKHWEENWKDIPAKNSLSMLNVFNYDAIKLLTSRIRGLHEITVVEIGFVPGKFLAYLHHHHGATCHGYDYSEVGCGAARKFLDSQKCEKHGVHVHCQDVLESPPAKAHSGNLVYSIGVVEHFSDPSGMIQAHLNPMAEDGVCIIILPNYTGFNYKIQKFLDPENLAIHNLNSMTSLFWEDYAKSFPDYQFRTYYRGRLNPWMYSLQTAGRLGSVIQFGLNFVSFLLPSNIKCLASMFVIEIRKR